MDSNSQAALSMLFTVLFAYLQGGLVLISGTWFRYQIVSRVLLHILSESSMYALLKQCKVKTTIALVARFTFMRQHSLFNTGRCVRGSLVGEQLYYLLFYSSNSLCLLSKVEPIRLALSMALIFQVHVLGAFDASDDVSSFFIFTLL